MDCLRLFLRFRIHLRIACTQAIPVSRQNRFGKFEDTRVNKMNRGLSSYSRQ